MRKIFRCGPEKIYKPQAFIIALFVIRKKQNTACSVVQDIPSKIHLLPNK